MQTRARLPPPNDTFDGPGAGRGGATPKATIQPPSEAEKTVTAVRRVVEAELTRGTGRLGGAHRQKLILLRDSIQSLERANRVGTFVKQIVDGAGAGAGGSGNDKSKIDPKEIFFGRARITSRNADLYVPKAF